ncbi:uncharacterized protein LOC130690709 [Daphnia carinata]|uniref:uncharacterized protein LOC130690709 n=1 Tax=Daphnia carinata TaxID=120202 RepID=UPI00257C65F4|nr:uncharacterized protein LOC130690709 [Daphnia carinata]
MDMAALKAIVHEIMNLIGKPGHSDCPRGGNMFVYPIDTTQQQALLQLTQIAGRTIIASLPNFLNGKKGIIKRVPLSESDEDLLDALKDQWVVKAQRFFRNNTGSKEPSESVLLTFDKALPVRISIIGLSFPVLIYYPFPYKYTICFRLGHTRNYCSSPSGTCKNCGVTHDPTDICIQKCINCNSFSHASESKNCPIYEELTGLIKFAIDKNITVKEARTHISGSYSSVVRRPTVLPPVQTSSPNTSQIEKMIAESSCSKRN